MPPAMRTASFKLPGHLVEALESLAQRRKTSRSALAREALERLVASPRRSFTAMAGELVGSVEGPADLATNPRHMRGFGR
jgi:predicted transcriptional regulator